MDRPSLAMTLGGDAARIDVDQFGVWRSSSRRRAAGSGFTPLSDPADDIGHLAIVRIEQIGLANKRVLDLARELEPVRRRPWA